MKTQCRGKRIGMAGVVSLLMAAGSQAVVREAGRETGEVIQPTMIHAGEPFTFAVTGSATGEVIELKTETGEVVQRARADKFGRVFLASGLASGAYLVSAGLHGTPQKMLIGLAAPSPGHAGPLRLDPAPEAINVAEPLRLTGEGFSPNAADMAVSGAPVLAATSHEVVSAANQQAPGMTDLTVRNNATGEIAKSGPTLAYSLQGHLEQRKLIGGQQTVLRLNFEPKNLPASVRTAVVQGPVNLGQGRNETVVVVDNGVAFVPVQANVGKSGPFTLAWSFEGLLYDAKPALPGTPRQLLQKKAIDCATASAVSENSQNKKALAQEADLDDAFARDDNNWNPDGTPKDPKKLQKFLEAEASRLEAIAGKEGDTEAGRKIKEAGKDAESAALADAGNPTAPVTPREWLRKKADECATASAVSENSKNKKALAAEAELDGKAASDDNNWDKDGKPKDPTKFGKFLNEEIARLQEISKREGGGKASGKITDAIGAAYSGGSAAGLELKNMKK